VSKTKVHTSRWAQEQKAKLEQVVNTGNGFEARFSTGERYVGGTPDEVMNNIARSEAERSANGMGYSSISDWYIDQNADKIMGAISKKLEFGSTDEMVQHFKGMGQNLQQNNDEMASMAFMAAHPEFPQTPESGDAVDKIMAEKGWQYIRESLSDAHAIAVQRGMYQPLTQQQIAIANGATVQHTRPTPPPLVRGNNPETHSQELDAWNMNLQDLRNRAIRQQLEGGR